MEDCPLALELGLSIQVGRGRLGVVLIRSIAGLAGEHVVGGNVSQQDASLCAEPSKCARCLDVESSCSLGVFVNLVGKPVGSGFDNMWVSLRAVLSNQMRC